MVLLTASLLKKKIEVNQPLVSIIVPCYKQAEYLPETLNSVLAQTYPNWECVIVNDGSPDNTEEVAQDYCKRDSRFKYVKKENGGLASARNYGIQYSSGEFVLPLDADDLIGSEYLEKAIRYFEEFPETKLVYCKAELFGKKVEYWDLDIYDYDRFIWRNCIFCTAMFRRHDYDKTKGYNVNMVHGYEDWDFWLTLLKREDVVYCIDEVLFYYRIKEISMSTELNKHHHYEALIQLCNNHPDIYDQYKGNILLYHTELERLSAREEDYLRIQRSYAYRLGKFLLKPFSWIRNMLK